MPCMAYGALMRLILTWQDVHVLVARCSLPSCMTYVVNCPCGKGLIVILSHSPSLARGSLMPSLARGSWWPSLTDAISFGVLAILALGNVNNVFGIFNVLDLGVFAPLILALRSTVVVAPCKQQHEILIVVWCESVQSSLAFICCCHCSSQYDNKK